MSKTCLDLETYTLLVWQFQTSFSFVHSYLLDTECFNLEQRCARIIRRLTVQDVFR